VDLDLATMHLVMRWLGLATEVLIRETYVQPEAGTLDLRDALHPKKPLPDGVSAARPYPQVFADRHGYQARMSIIDLLCNCGPQAATFLR
jgi:hypothetical protein